MANSDNHHIYNLSWTDGDNMELYIYGDIESGTIDRIIHDMMYPDKKPASLDVRINSYGGDLSEGVAVYNFLRSVSAKGTPITTYIDGIAASAASIIFMAGDSRIMPDSTIFMVHYPWMATAGNTQQLQSDASVLEKMGESMAHIYEERSSLTLDQVHSLLEGAEGDGSWLDAEEALGYGLCTKIEESQTTTQAMMKSAVKALLRGIKKDMQKGQNSPKGQNKENDQGNDKGNGQPFNISSLSDEENDKKENKKRDDEKAKNKEGNIEKNEENANSKADGNEPSLFKKLKSFTIKQEVS